MNNSEENKELKKYAEKMKKAEMKQTYKNKISDLKKATYTKRLVAWITGVCLLDLQFTYILAYLDKAYIAETLSSDICKTIIGVALVYMIRAYFDTKAEHAENASYYERYVQELEEIGKSKVENITGVDIDNIIPDCDINDDSYGG